MSTNISQCELVSPFTVSLTKDLCFVIQEYSCDLITTHSGPPQI